MILPYKRYADFRGRSRRMEYWMFALFQVIVAILLVVLAGIGGAGDAADAGAYLWSSLGGMLLLLFVVVNFIPSLAVQVRRFHDQDRSGWFILLSFIPFVGGLIVFVFMLLDGTRGPNRFGPDPKQGSAGEVFA